MIRRGQITTFQERLDITERATAGQSDTEIAAALGCSVWTVRKWRRIGQRHGRISLTSRMGRPPTGVLGTFPPTRCLASIGPIKRPCGLDLMRAG